MIKHLAIILLMVAVSSLQITAQDAGQQDTNELWVNALREQGFSSADSSVLPKDVKPLQINSLDELSQFAWLADKPVAASVTSMQTISAMVSPSSSGDTRKTQRCSVAHNAGPLQTFINAYADVTVRSNAYVSLHTNWLTITGYQVFVYMTDVHQSHSFSGGRSWLTLNNHYTLNAGVLTPWGDLKITSHDHSFSCRWRPSN